MSDPDPDTTLVAPVPAVGDRYELGHLLGSGGFGSVYAARDKMLDRDVAIKIIRPRTNDGIARQRFLREARATARFQHPNVVRLYDAGDGPFGAFLVLELVRGKSLATRMEEGLVSRQESVSIVQQIATALDAGQREGIVHRDLKPANVLLTNDGNVKLADFGLARTEGEERLTREGMVAGTPRYMAPELMIGEEATAASDIFSLGVVLYELLIGSHPFRASTGWSAHATQPLPLPPPLDKDPIGPLLRKMLHPDPAHRPSAIQVVAGLASPQAPRGGALARYVVAVAIAAVALFGAASWLERSRTLGESNAQSSPPARAATNEAATAAIRAAMTGASFFEEPNLFTGEESSKRLITAELDQYPVIDFIQLIAAATGWPVIIDRTAALTADGRPATITARLDDAPWDVVLKSLLERLDIRERSEGRLWMLATSSRWKVTDSYHPTTTVFVPAAGNPATLTTLLEPARTERGVIVSNRRLNGVVISDHRNAFADYARIARAAGPQMIAVDTYLGTTESRFTGEPISFSLRNAEIVGLLKLFSQIGETSIVVDPDVRGTVTVELKDIPWDQALDSILRSQGLTSVRRAGVIQVLPESKLTRELRIETVKLKNEDPEFFRPFARTLSSRGSLVINSESGLLVIRDTEAFATNFSTWARNLDAVAPPR